jgi:hypothetical protein
VRDRRAAGMSAETPRKWVRQAEVDAGQAAGVPTESAREIRELKRKNAELERTIEMADSTGGRNEPCECLRWCQIAEGLARTAVKTALDAAKIRGGDLRQVGAFRQVLTQQPVDASMSSGELVADDLMLPGGLVGGHRAVDDVG